VKCPRGQADNPTTGRFCGQCGAPLAVRCPRAGTSVTAGNPFRGATLPRAQRTAAASGRAGRALEAQRDARGRTLPVNHARGASEPAGSASTASGPHVTAPAATREHRIRAWEARARDSTLTAPSLGVWPRLGHPDASALRPTRGTPRPPVP
jgi:hypothetical protein